MYAFTTIVTLFFQKAEAAAAVQQQEAKAAAQSLVRAQQRLAQTKAEVSEAQRMAAHKEAYAAALIQKSANAAAHEIQKTGKPKPSSWAYWDMLTRFIILCLNKNSSITMNLINVICLLISR